MNTKLLDKYLFTLDIANNHFGDLKHAIDILNTFIPIVKESNLNVSIKIQLRKIETFIHPSFIGDKRFPKIERFLSTRLNQHDFIEIINVLKSNNILTIATPFDEESIGFIVDNDIDIIKIASASAQEWPLIKKVVLTKKPVIISTGGLSIEEIDSLYYFFLKAGVEFALMHCVSIYPTRNNDLNLNQIDTLKRRYPDIPIGFSTHEMPDEYDPIKLALARGATIFERHIGLDSFKYKLNTYSSNPSQINKWFEEFKKAQTILGSTNRMPSKLEEIDDLNALKRGVYARVNISEGEIIDETKVFFSMPLLPKGVSLKNWKTGIHANREIKALEMLNLNDYIPESNGDEVINSSLIQAKSLIKTQNISIPKGSGIELSHHYGVMRFREFGAIIVNVINFSYCKKLIIVLPRQKHPYHFHKIKQETFIIVFGDLFLEVEGIEHNLVKGDKFTIEKEKWHKFQSSRGCIFEEISTTSLDNDSFYQDEKISFIEKSKRKSDVTSLW